MKYYYLFVIFTIAFAISPNCEITGDSSFTLYTTANQLQSLNLSKYFSGYNLNYDINPKPDQISLITPIYLNEQLPLPNPVKSGSKRVSVDILVDSNKAWRNQGASLIIKDTSAFTVAFGELNENSNLVFNEQITINHTDPTNCFGLNLIEQGYALVDCQKVGTNQDRFYLIQSGNPKAVLIEKDDSILEVTDRKSILLRTNDDIFLLSTTSYDSIVDDRFQEDTFITVYHISSDDWTPQYVLTIDAFLLGLDSLTITDMTIDSQGQIYITDLNQGLIQFYYLASNEITTPVVTSVGAEKSLKVATLIDANQNLLVQILTQNSIKQLRWPTGVVRSYEIPYSLDKVQNLFLNAQVIVIQTQTQFYFYKLGETRLKHLLYQTGQSEAIALLNIGIPQAIIVGNNKTKSFIISQGYLQINNVPDDQNIVITATSISGQDSVQCQLNLFINKIQNTDVVYSVKNFPNISSIQSPELFSIPIEDYFAGSRLDYSFPQSPYFNINNNIISDVQVIGSDLTTTDFFITYRYSQHLYYRVSRQNYNYAMNFEACSLKDNNVDCRQFKLVMIMRTILSYTVFEMIKQGNKIGVIGFIFNESPNWINFTTIHTFNQFPAKQLSQIPSSYKASDLDINSNFIFVTVKDLRKIFVYKNDGKNYPLITTISKNTFKNIQYFYPRQTQLSPTDTNIFFIKDIQSIYIMKVFSTGVAFIANLPVENGSELSWTVVIGNNNLVIISVSLDATTSSIVQYGIYDIYHPLKMREINIPQTIAVPLYVINIPGCDHIYIRTQDNNQYYLSVIKMGKSTISSNFIRLPFDSSSRIVGANLQNRNIIQITQWPTNSIPSLTWMNKAVYNNPSIVIIPKQSDLRLSFPYSFIMKSQTNEISINSTLNVYNYVFKITNKTINDERIGLPKQTKNMIINIDTSKWFDGPISSYAITCPYCNNNNIVLNDRIVQQRSYRSGITNANDFIYAGGRLWILNNQAVYQTDLVDNILAPPILLNLTSQFSCTSFQLLQNQLTLLVYCKAPSKQWFVPISLETLTVLAPIPIERENFFENVYTMKSKGKFLYVLDNNINGDGIGEIKVFKYENTNSLTIEYQYSITENSFAATSQSAITDFEIAPIPNSQAAAFMVVLKQIGIGYAIFDPSGDVQIIGGYIAIANNDAFKKYTLDKTQFLQLSVISFGVQQTILKYNVILTVTSGEHLYLQVIFDTGKYSGVVVLNTFNKYGNQQVLNWAQAIQSIQNKDNYLLVAYLNQNNKITIAVYQIVETRYDFPINFVTSIYYSNTNRLIGLLFRSDPSNDLVFVKWGHPDDNRNIFYRFNSTFSLEFNYDAPGDFSTIVLSATNDYSTVNHNIDIKFAETIKKKKSKWYIALIVIGIVGIGVGVFFYLRRKKIKELQESLIGSQIQQDGINNEV